MVRTICLLLLWALIYSSPALAADCFSCRIEIQSLAEPIDLRGLWKFTKEDHPANASPDTKIDSWPVVMAPGGWDKVYPDEDPFMVGWYRGELYFAKDLVGKEVTILLDAYMSRVAAYLDGENIFSRGGKNSYGKYYSIQPIPIRFQIKKEHHTIAFRIETNLMKGVYQLPFQIQQYKKDDFSLAFSHFWGGELRLMASIVTASFGLFFLLVYIKIRARIYLIASLAGLAIFPFYGLPSDVLIRFFDPLTLQMLHYTGIGSLAMFHGYYAQFFYKFYPRFNMMNFIVNGFLISCFVYFLFDFHHGAFLSVRKVLFLYANLVSYQFIYVLFRAVRRNKLAIPLLVGEFFMFLCSIHDILLALGYIQSVSLLFFGTLVATIAIMFVASNLFATTFLENKGLLASIEGVNKNLESKVDERTAELKKKTEDIDRIAAEQANAIQSTVNNLDEIAKAVNLDCKNLGRSTDEADHSHKIVGEGRNAVNQMRLSMEDIETTISNMVEQVDSSNNSMQIITKIISEITSKTAVINDIVFQTKLLSFNASVEAARAGEHGKGFAIVAEEVGNLAQMSGQAAKEISDLLGNSSDQVHQIVEKSRREMNELVAASHEKVASGVSQANHCDEIFVEIVDRVSHVKELIDHLYKSALEQAEGVNKISDTMKELEEATSSNSKKDGYRQKSA